MTARCKKNRTFFFCRLCRCKRGDGERAGRCRTPQNLKQRKPHRKRRKPGALIPETDTGAERQADQTMETNVFRMTGPLVDHYGTEAEAQAAVALAALGQPRARMGTIPTDSEVTERFRGLQRRMAVVSRASKGQRQCKTIPASSHGRSGTTETYAKEKSRGNGCPARAVASAGPLRTYTNTSVHARYLS